MPGNPILLCGIYSHVNRALNAILISLFFCFGAESCDCDQGMLECSFAAAQIVFKGRVDYDNDDGNGSFVQRTLIGFKVSEVFKGLPSSVDHLWVDPGSFTSCYAEYRWGQEYLVFAYSGVAMPTGTSLMTLAQPGSRVRQLPPEFVSGNSPPVYFAPECMGTRPADYPDFNNDLALVRRYAAGTPIPRIVGQVALSPYSPGSSKGKMAGVNISIQVGNRTWGAQTNSEGKFFFYDLPPEGVYEVAASYPDTITGHASLRVFSETCSYLYMTIQSKRSFAGRVVDNTGGASRGVTVGVQLVSESDGGPRPFATTQTDQDGRFSIGGIPPEAVRVAVFSKSPNRVVAANPPVYYPNPITTSDPQSDSKIVIRLPEHVHKRWVRMRVLFSDGAPVKRATIFIRDRNSEQLDIDTDSNGIAKALLVADVQYELQAWKRLDTKVSWHSLLSKTVQFTPSSSATLDLVLDHVRRYWDDSDR